MREIIPNLSIDCVIFGFDGEHLNILLNERKIKGENENETLIDYKLMGQQVYTDETAEEAAQRVLKEVTGFDNIYLEQFHTFTELDRFSKKKDRDWVRDLNPKISSRVITIGYYALVDCKKFTPDDEHSNISWFPVNKIPELAFDHKKILHKGLEMLRLKVQHDPIIFELLPEKFTLTELQSAYEGIFNIKFDRRNFRKKIQLMKFIIALDEKQTGVKHKPATIYIFSRDVYERTKKEKLILPL